MSEKKNLFVFMIFYASIALCCFITVFISFLFFTGGKPFIEQLFFYFLTMVLSLYGLLCFMGAKEKLLKLKIEVKK